MKRRAPRPVAGLLLLTGLLLAGCSGPLSLTVAGEPGMNSGHAASVFIYQLAGDTNFRRTPIEVFWRDDEQALGHELVGAKKEILLYPDEARTLEIDLDDQAKYVGIAADLRNPEADHWRRIYPVDAFKGADVAVSVGSGRLAVQVE